MLKSSNIGKRGRALVKVLAGVAVVLISVFLLLQQPYIQTKLASRSLAKLSAKFPGEVSVGRLRLYPFNTLILDDLLLLDDNPFKTDKFAPQDTILHAGKVVVKFALRDIFHKDKIFLSRASVSDACVNVVIEDKHTNIERMLPENNSDGTEPYDIHIGRLSAENVRARILFERDLPAPATGAGIDYNDIRVRVNATAHDFRIQDHKRVGAVADRLEVFEACGYHIHSLTGKIQTSPGLVRFEDLHLRDDWSDVWLPLYAMHSESAHSYARFTDEVGLEGIVRDSDLSGRTIAVFAPALADAGFDERIYIREARVNGPVNGLMIPVLDFDRLRGAQGRIAVSLKNIINVSEASCTVRVDRIQYPFRGQVSAKLPHRRERGKIQKT